LPLEKARFRILFREFLLRIVDIDILPSPGDALKLMGQIAALLAAFNALFAMSVRRFAEMEGPLEKTLSAAWGLESFLIATTMLVTGLLGVMAWDNAFPDRRDVLVLAPLPVASRTILFAKLAALGCAFAVAVLAVNVFTGFSFPMILGGIHGGRLRWLGAWWATAFAAAAFVMGTLLTMQGMVAALLPRRYGLRVSGVLQLATFVVLLGLYFLQPPLPIDSAAAGWVPSFWFLGLLTVLNGGGAWAAPVVGVLAGKAVVAVGVATAGAVLSMLLAYRSMARKMVEEPDIVSSTGSAWDLPWPRAPLTRAILQFSARSLARSRQMRLIFALYAGVGLALAMTSVQRGKWDEASEALLGASIVFLLAVGVGARVVFAMPLHLKANWVFQITELQPSRKYLRAIRVAFFAIGTAGPVLLAAGLLALIWPARTVLGHVVLLAMIAWVLGEFCLQAFSKIPFTCSYLPGQSGLHVRAGAFALVLIAVTEVFTKAERYALGNLRGYLWVCGFLALLGAWASWKTRTAAAESLRYEEVEVSEVQPLMLQRDGAWLGK
jgi:hypothetical protein